MMMACGHVICKESMDRLAKTTGYVPHARVRGVC
jgi:hypothetical protein